MMQSNRLSVLKRYFDGLFTPVHQILPQYGEFPHYGL